jgi:hypothetical protein
MDKLQKIFLGIGVVLLVFIPVWMFLVVPEMEKIPGNFERKFELLSTNDANYDLSGWSGIRIENGLLMDTPSSSDKETIVLESNFKSETLSGEITWQTENRFKISRKTNLITEVNGNSFKDSYYIFPKNVKKKDYDAWILGSADSIEISYVDEENVNGLNTYHFTGKEREKDNTVEFSWLDLVPETYNAFSVQSVDLWVEPVSGLLINHKDDGFSYYVDKTTGEKIENFNKWTNKFSDDTIANQVRLAQNEKQRIILIEKIVPILLFIIAAALFIAAHWGGGALSKIGK